MSNSARFDETAYYLLEKRIAAFRYLPGARLSPEKLSSEIRIGLTPTRTALHWLYRDGLIDHEPGRGFFVKTPTEADMISLYRSNRIQIEGTLSLEEPASPISLAGEEDFASEAALSPLQGESDAKTLAALTASTFLDIATLSRSDVVINAVRVLNSRLYFLRQAECRVLGKVGAELFAMQHLLARNNYAELRQFIYVYHQMRLEKIGALLDAAFAIALRARAA